MPLLMLGGLTRGGISIDMLSIDDRLWSDVGGLKMEADNCLKLIPETQCKKIPVQQEEDTSTYHNINSFRFQLTHSLYQPIDES